MIGQFFSVTFLELSDLELPHRLMAAGSVLVIIGTIGAFVSSRRAKARKPRQRQVGNGSRARRAYDALPPPSVID
jgi:hypothetical protein